MVLGLAEERQLHRLETRITKISRTVCYELTLAGNITQSVHPIRQINVNSPRFHEHRFIASCDFSLIGMGSFVFAA